MSHPASAIGAGSFYSMAVLVVPDAAPAREPKQLTLDLGGGVTMEMVLIPTGEFMRGSPDAGSQFASVEQPQHRVRITQPFYLGKCEVTQEQWLAVMGSNPSNFKQPRNPVEQVSWDDCQAFLAKLNEKQGSSGVKFTLPTEAQWEYAARAGSTTGWCFGDDASAFGEYAWYDGNSPGRTRPVGQKKPNAWGLYDVHGNVWEWCQDWYGSGYYATSPPDDPTGPATGAGRVRRGGGWDYGAAQSRFACRLQAAPRVRISSLGFRVCRAAAEPEHAPAKPPEPLRVNPIAGQTVEIGSLLTVAASVENAKRWEGKLRFSLGPQTPAGASIDLTTGVLSWTPTQAQGPGKHDVTVSVEGPEGQRDQTSFAITVTGPSRSPLKEIRVDLGGGVTMEMVFIPPGEFLMGSPDSDGDARPDEKPQHRVRITKPFYLGKYEVTQEQWQAVMGNNPSSFKGSQWPVDTVSWSDCQGFFDRLNAKPGGDGVKFSLPTEAQWEYACRAGSATRWCFGDDPSGLGDYAWYRDNSAFKTRPVGQKKPNAWGLYDVHGSIAEWCADWDDSRYYRNSPADDPVGPASGFGRVRRDGWRHNTAKELRSAYRLGLPPGFRNSDTGFRVARIAVAPDAPGAAGVSPSPQPSTDDLPAPAGRVRLSGPSNVDIQRNQVYRFGEWRLFWPSDRTDVCFWHQDGSSAIEIIGNSNGWWHVRHGGTEYVVWSVGNTSTQSFNRRPWEQSGRTAGTAIRSFREFTVGESRRATHFSCDGGRITVVLTDGGKVSVLPTSPVVQYTTKSGKTVQFPGR